MSYFECISRFLFAKHRTLAIQIRFQVQLITLYAFISDQRQISLCNINAFSARKVIGIKDMITQHKFRW